MAGISQHLLLLIRQSFELCAVVMVLPIPVPCLLVFTYPCSKDGTYPPRA